MLRQVIFPSELSCSRSWWALRAVGRQTAVDAPSISCCRSLSRCARLCSVTVVLIQTTLPLRALGVNPQACVWRLPFSLAVTVAVVSKAHSGQATWLISSHSATSLFAFTMLRLSGTIVANLLACLLKSNYQRLISVLGKFPSYMISTEALSQLNVIVFAELAQPWSWKLALSHTHDKTTDCLVRHPTKNNAASCNNLHHPSGFFHN